MPTFANEGHGVVAGWNNAGSLQNITALTGTDSLTFQPVNDRNGYTPGVEQRIPSGGVYYEGFPIVRFTSPWISDGQIDYLYNTLLSGAASGNVTVRYHKYDSVGKTDTFNANAVLNLNLEQLTDLERLSSGYKDYVWEFVIVENL